MGWKQVVGGHSNALLKPSAFTAAIIVTVNLVICLTTWTFLKLYLYRQKVRLILEVEFFFWCQRSLKKGSRAVPFIRLCLTAIRLLRFAHKYNRCLSHSPQQLFFHFFEVRRFTSSSFIGLPCTVVSRSRCPAGHFECRDGWGSMFVLPPQFLVYPSLKSCKLTRWAVRVKSQ